MRNCWILVRFLAGSLGLFRHWDSFKIRVDDVVRVEKDDDGVYSLEKPVSGGNCTVVQVLGDPGFLDAMEALGQTSRCLDLIELGLSLSSSKEEREVMETTLSRLTRLIETEASPGGYLREASWRGGIVCSSCRNFVGAFGVVAETTLDANLTEVVFPCPYCGHEVSVSSPGGGNCVERWPGRV
jgi:predicted RNA-binding Zn-ribbon protein involved in translation (DUF1610 family)